jgi:hypothetical protein
MAPGILRDMLAQHIHRPGVPEDIPVVSHS